MQRLDGPGSVTPTSTCPTALTFPQKVSCRKASPEHRPDGRVRVAGGEFWGYVSHCATVKHQTSSPSQVPAVALGVRLLYYITTTRSLRGALLGRACDRQSSNDRERPLFTWRRGVRMATRSRPIISASTQRTARTQPHRPFSPTSHIHHSPLHTRQHLA